MRFSPELGNKINLYSRLFCFSILLFITNDKISAQGGCPSAFPIYNAPNQNLMNGVLDPNFTGVPGFVGCFNFLDKPTNWYQIEDVTYGSQIRIDLNWSAGNIQVAAYTGTCNNLIPVQCQILKPWPGINRGPESSLFLESLNNGDYYIQIGYPDGRTDPYELVVNYEVGTPSCSTLNSDISASYTSMNSPLEGPFKAGEIVNFCAQIQWDTRGTNCQWLHGVTPILGAGWDPTFYINNGPPLTSTSSGQFSWYPDYYLTYNYDGQYYNAGDFVPAGWYVTGTPGSNNCNIQEPQCSWGISQPCNSFSYHTLCFDLKVRDDIDCNLSTAAADLSVGVFTFGDGETGGWPQQGCDEDGAFIKNFGAECCEQLGVFIPDKTIDVCGGVTTVIDLEEILINANVQFPQLYSFVYQTQFSTAQINFSDCFENCGREIIIDPFSDLQDYGWMKFRVSVLDAENCYVGEFDYRVNIYQPDYINPEITPSSNNYYICENNLPLTLTASVENPCDSPFDFYWTGPDGFTSDQMQISVSVPGDYEFHTINILGVGRISDYTLRTTAAQNISFNIPDQICPSIYLQNVLDADPPNGSWSGPSVQGSLLYAPDPGIYTVTYNVVGSAGCTLEASFDIEVVLDPDVSVEFPDYVCISDQLQDVLIPSPAGGTFDPSPILEGDQVLATQAGAYPITYRYGDVGGICNGSFTFTLNVEDEPNVVLSMAVSEICQSSIPADIISADPAGGTFLTTNVDGDGNFIPENLGVNTIEYSYTNPVTGCSGTALIDIIVVEGDPIAIDDPGIVCTFSSIQLMANPAGGTWSGIDVTSAGTFTPQIGDDYLITYTYENADGCISAETVEIEVTNGTAIAVDFPEVVCNNAGPQPIIAIPAGGTFDNFINAQNEFIPDTPGTYDITYTYVNTQGCESFYSFSIEVEEFLVPQIIYPQDAVCLSQSTTYSLLADAPGGLFSGSSVTPSGEFAPIVEGVNQITYGPGPDNECLASINFDIEVIQDLNVLVSHPEVLCRRPLPYDVLAPNIPGGTWTGPITADGRFQAFTIGNNEVTYEVEDPDTGCFGTYTFEIEVVQTSDLPTPQLITPVIDDFCIYEIIELCIDPVPGATDYRWDSNFGIIEYASPNHLCIRIAWNALVQDEICITPSGDCGNSTNPLCIPVTVVDNSNCVIIATGIANSEAQQYTVFPNPTIDNVEIKSNQQLHSVSLINTLGEIIFTKDKINSKRFLLELDKATPGIYFVLINGERMERILLTK